MTSTKSSTETIVLGGGCFWCLETVYRQVEGVTSVISGYAGGHVANPDYWTVASKASGHAEVVQVTFEPKVISLGDILEIFWAMHDPTSLDQQGYDKGPEYRSIILYDGDDQKSGVEASVKAAQKLFDKPIVTEVKPLDKFYEAEAEHQNFYESGQRPDYCQVVINPKLAKLRQKFAARLKAKEAS
ncbi:MAG TPA: peptide-methionine (S)-S-oxide reductase MsrA [Candidatus Saccharimonadia bacterium]|jgi:peptide-methionine (S)-S-oxide reductase|nr:peptide-methionine (S)-S-oxide reductase MsrA [Candidatus Saccharimonadia bacterium]